MARIEEHFGPAGTEPDTHTVKHRPLSGCHTKPRRSRRTFTVNPPLSAWTVAHSAICTAFLAAAALLGASGEAWTGRLLPAYGAASFAALILIQKSRLLIADLITLLRLTIGLSALALLSQGIFAPDGPGRSTVFFILAVASVTDVLDGLAARRWGGSDFGAKLDLETDAYFMLLLSCICVFYYKFGLWVLVFGALRYAYVLVMTALPPSKTIPQPLSRYEKLACAAAVFSLTAATAPVNAPLLKKVFLLVSLAMLVFSFALDLEWRVRNTESKSRPEGKMLYRPPGR